MRTRYRLRLDSPETFNETEFTNRMVWMLKQVRMLGNPDAVGLKKGKETLLSLAERPLDSVVLEGEETLRSHIASAIANLADCGIIAEPAGPLATIKEAAVDAMELGQHELCKDILEVLLKHGGSECQGPGSE